MGSKRPKSQFGLAGLQPFVFVIISKIHSLLGPSTSSVEEKIGFMGSGERETKRGSDGRVSRIWVTNPGKETSPVQFLTIFWTESIVIKRCKAPGRRQRTERRAE